jgi:uncharacterized protein YkwD
MHAYKMLLARSTLRVCGLAVSVVVAVGLAAGNARAAVGHCVPASDWGKPDAALASQVVDLVNQHRKHLGLAPVGVLPTLTASAQWKSQHMAAHGYLAHEDPAPPFSRTTSDRIGACGYSGHRWGENIAHGYGTAQNVMNAWLSSPEHRANIENGSYRALGVGVVRAADGTLYWTQDFGNVLDFAQLRAR